MKTFISMVLTTFLFLSWAPTVSAHAHHHGTEQNQSYACPMHPEVTGNQSESCPKCGMDLQAVKSAEHQCDSCPNKGKQTHHKMTADTHACPMNPAITGKAGDSCPKCGMELKAMKAKGKSCDSCPHKGKGAHHKMSADTHACPMNPAITGKAGDSCPKCGMELQAMKAKGKSCDSCPHKGKGEHHKMNADTHACPMNPAITGKEGDSCPKCGMDLMPIANSDSADKKSHMHH